MRWNKKLFVILTSFTLVLIIIAVVNVFIFQSSNNYKDYFNNCSLISNAEKYEQIQNNEKLKNNLKNLQLIDRSRTASISFISNESSKVSGTAWFNRYDAKNNDYIFSTNLHVVLPFMYYNSAQNVIKLDYSALDSVNVRFFKQDFSINSNEPKLFLARTNDENWSINLETLKNSLFLNREIKLDNQSNVDLQNYENVFNVTEENINTVSKKTFIDNGYIDYIELRYHVSNQTVNEFKMWLSNNHKLFNILNEKSLNNVIQFPTNISMNNINKSNEFLYVAGFPIYNNNLAFQEEIIPFSDIKRITTTWSEFVTTDAYLESDMNMTIKIDDRKEIGLRSVSRQLLFTNATLGHGSSGSLVYSFNETSFSIVGIWWGKYGSKIGAIDLLSSEKYSPVKNSGLVWNGYSFN